VVAACRFFCLLALTADLEDVRAVGAGVVFGWQWALRRLLVSNQVDQVGVRVMVQLDLVGLQKALEFELLSGWLWLVAMLD
jgi:hypothetical protein